MIKVVVSFLVGYLFSIGLIISKMTDPRVIVGFLDIFGDWKPDLALVMIGALAVHIPLSRYIFKKPSPLFDKKFHLPEPTKIDAELLLGSVFFGVGWGLAGFCPGPAVIALGTGSADAIWFFGFMLLGMWFQTKCPLLVCLKKLYGSGPDSAPHGCSPSK